MSFSGFHLWESREEKMDGWRMLRIVHCFMSRSPKVTVALEPFRLSYRKGGSGDE